MAIQRGGTCHGYYARKGRERTASRKTSDTNICFDCQKALGGCAWSEINPETSKPRFEPIPGWTAEKVTMTVNHKGGVYSTETYAITDCPLFVRDEPRKVDYRMLTDRQSQAFLDNIQHILRRWADG